MKIRTGWLVLLPIAFCNVFSAVVEFNRAASGGVAKVYLGENAQSGTVPVLLSETAINHEVNVSCLLSSADSSLSLAFFSSVVIGIGQTSGSIPIRFGNAGLPNRASCFGESLGAGTQFLKNESTGSEFVVELALAPVVTICSGPIAAKSYLRDLQYFTVYLSDVPIHPVEVRCSSTTETLEAGLPYLNVSFQDVTIAASQFSGLIAYRMFSEGLPISITCTAQSSCCNATCSSIVVQQVSSTVPLPPSTSSIVPSSSTRTSIAPNPTPIDGCQYLAATSKSGDVVMTSFQSSITMHPLAAEGTLQYSHTSFIKLNSALDVSEDLELDCAVAAIDIASVGMPICDAASGNHTSGGLTVIANGLTLVVESFPTSFKTGDLYKNITVRFINGPSVTTQQLFRVYCCVKPGHPRFVFQDVSSYLSITTLGVKPLNWSSVPDVAKHVMTTVKQLDYTCPCDLTSDACNANCCCDKDCTAAEMSAFICAPGQFGGLAMKKWQFSCSAEWPYNTGWQPLLCVVTNNNPFIGLFFDYPSPALTQNTAEFNQLLTSETSRVYSYEETEQRTPGRSTLRGYVVGQKLMTRRGTLAFPSPFPNGVCQFTNIHYLSNRYSQCILVGSSSVCNNPIIDARNYVTGDTASSALCSDTDGVLSGAVSGNTIPTTVEYYCVTEPISFASSTSNDSSSADGVDSVTAADSTSRRCTFDTTKVRPPSPQWNATTSTCDNAVIDVSYLFYWNGVELQSLAAKITLATVPLRSVIITTTVASFPVTQSLAVFPSLSSNVSINSTLSTAAVVAVNQSTIVYTSSVTPSMRQKFTVTYFHTSVIASASSASSASASLASTPAAAAAASVSTFPAAVAVRSGNPGYIDGKPLFTQSDEDIIANTTTTNGLLIRRVTASGLCNDATLSPILFNQQLLTQCSLSLGIDSFQDCKLLREQIADLQLRLVTARRLAKRGNPNPSLSSDWIHVIRDNFTSAGGTPTRFGLCDRIPAGLAVDILTAQGGMSNGKRQMEVAGVRVRFIDASWQSGCSNGASNKCLNLTSSSSASALSYGSQLFHLVTTVSYAEIPATEPEPKRKSEIGRGCVLSVCSEELFYPFTLAYDALPVFGLERRQIQTSMAYILTLLLVLIIGLFVKQLSGF